MEEEEEGGVTVAIFAADTHAGFLSSFLSVLVARSRARRGARFPRFATLSAALAKEEKRRTFREYYYINNNKALLSRRSRNVASL